MKVSRLKFTINICIFMLMAYFLMSCSAAPIGKEGGIGGTGTIQQCDEDEIDNETGECVESVK